MPRNDTAAPGHVCPGTHIHAIDIAQPPGIDISPIADIDSHQKIVSAALAAKSSAETPKKARPEAIASDPPAPGSAPVVLVVAAPPGARARLVASLGGTVEPLVHPPEAIHSARVGGVRVVDRAVLHRERAHAGPLAQVRGLVGSCHGREGGSSLAAGLRSPRVLAPVVVFDALALLLLGEPDGEVGVEIAGGRGRPRERPPEPPLVRL